MWLLGHFGDFLAEFKSKTHAGSWETLCPQILQSKAIGKTAWTQLKELHHGSPSK